MILKTIPTWLSLAAEAYLALCVLCFLYILLDQKSRPAPMNWLLIRTGVKSVM